MRFEGLRRERAGKLPGGGVDSLADQRRLLAVGPDREVLLEMVDRRQGIIDVLQVEQPHLEVRVRRIVAALVDHPEERGERLLPPAVLEQGLALAVARLVRLGRPDHPVIVPAAGQRQREERGEREDGAMQGDRTGHERK